MANRRRGQRAKSEMNVVPYIDVMLVLLVIFMISAPLLNQSVEVDLPNSDNAEDVATNNEVESPNPLVVSIDRQGAYYIDRADDNALPVNQQLIARLTREALAENKKTPIYIRADKSVDYGAVMVMMDILKSSGAQAVGLITISEDR
ncbi:MAG: protein TolR [Gammaproteobacteria bacterium]|nr:MAG: protein TolR [Gammaproteobacteria bacterium]